MNPRRKWAKINGMDGETKEKIKGHLAEHRKLCRNGGRMPQRKTKSP